MMHFGGGVGAKAGGLQNKDNLATQHKIKLKKKRKKNFEDKKETKEGREGGGRREGGSHEEL